MHFSVARCLTLSYTFTADTQTMDSLTFKLPTELRASLEALAKADGRSLSDYIRRHFASTLPNYKPSKKKGGAK